MIPTITDGNRREDSMSSECADTSTKCARFLKYCAKNKMIQKSCKASCNLCGK